MKRAGRYVYREPLATWSPRQLRAERVQARLSREAVAIITRGAVSAGTLGLWERGEAVPDATRAVYLAEVYGCPLAAFFSGQMPQRRGGARPSTTTVEGAGGTGSVAPVSEAPEETPAPSPQAQDPATEEPWLGPGRM